MWWAKQQFLQRDDTTLKKEWTGPPTPIFVLMETDNKNKTQNLQD